MTNSNRNNSNDDSKSRENIFHIMDGIIAQLNRTKKMFIIMILTIMIIPPIAFVLTFQLLGPPFHVDDARARPHDGSGPPPHIAVGRIIPFIISFVWLAIGVWQWSVLSKWTKKYERYKEFQKRVDDKLDDNDNNNVNKEGQQQR